MEVFELLAALVVDRDIASLLANDDLGTEPAKLAEGWSMQVLDLLAAIVNVVVAAFMLNV